MLMQSNKPYQAPPLRQQVKRPQSRWLALVLLLVLFAQTALASRHLSLTYDEPLYIAIGYADLTTRDVRWHEVIGHPPLVNLLTAWPLLLDPNQPDARQIPSWGSVDSLGFSRAMVKQLGPLERTTFVTRIPVMWLSLLLAAFVYRWAQQAWGGKAGLLALGLFVFDPHIVAHGQLNTTDIGVTAFGFITSYALARYLRRPRWGTYLGVGVGMGAALASKASGPFWPGVVVLIVALVWALEKRTSRLRQTGIWGLRLAGWMLLALLVLWGAYLFELRPLAHGGWPVPAASHWAGLAYIRDYMAEGQKTFLSGRLITGGHWGYFPLALLIKTPISTLIGMLIAAACFLRRGPKHPWRVLPLVVIPGAYLIVAMGMALNIGHRHMLTIYPFCFVFVAQLFGDGGMIDRRSPGWQWILSGLLMGYYVIGTVRIFPHYLTYFNEIAGGPDGGYRYLADSSVDWGQGLKILERYLDEQDIPQVRLAAFSSMEPALYDLSYQPLPPTIGAPITLTARFNPQPGVYAISPVPLQGIWVLDPDTYDWFRHRQPRDRVGHNFFIYDVKERIDASWVAQCAAPQPSLTPVQVTEGFGRHDLRLAPFNCETSWLYPAGATGWTVLPGDQPLTDWASKRLAQIPLSFRQREFWSHPALAIYEQRESPAGAIPPHTDVHIAPSEWPLDRAATEGTVISAPVSMAGPLTFLGYNVQAKTDAIELHTYWRVDDSPARPLSLMAHLLDTTGRAVAVEDGLGVPIEVWRPGDVIVQRHRIAAQDLPPGVYWLQTGAYWLDTMARWPVTIDGQTSGDRILLAEISR